LKSTPPELEPLQFQDFQDFRPILARLLDRGYTESPLEKSIILFAASNAPPLPIDESLVRALLGVDSLDRLREIEEQFEPPVELTPDQSSSLVERVLTHFRIRQTLGYLQRLTAWPPDAPCADPRTAYAALYGAHKHGLSTHSDQAVLEIISATTALFFPLVTEFVSADRVFLPPEEWARRPPKSAAPARLSTNDFAALFQTVVSLGFPEGDGSPLDLPRIANFAGLSASQSSAIEAECALLLRFAKQELDAESEAALVERLGPLGKRIWVARLRSNHKDLCTVRAFWAGLTPERRALIERAPPWEHGPSWWGCGHDAALLAALAEFGLLRCLTWVLDPKRPFLERVPGELLGAFRRLAALEAETGCARAPPDAGDFACVISGWSRMSRALAVIRSVEAHGRPGADTARRRPRAPLGANGAPAAMRLGAVEGALGP
jgi:hypothetical protein